MVVVCQNNYSVTKSKIIPLSVSVCYDSCARELSDRCVTCLCSLNVYILNCLPYNSLDWSSIFSFIPNLTVVKKYEFYTLGVGTGNLFLGSLVHEY